MNGKLAGALGACLVVACSGVACAQPSGGVDYSSYGADYSKRAAPLDPSIRTRLVGKWTNPVDNIIVEITDVDLTSGKITGKEWPTVKVTERSSQPGTEHELTGWVTMAPPRAGADNVIPVSFSTSLFEYGTLPVWAGFLRDDKIVTSSLLVWPVKTYTWDHIAAFQETWTKIS